MLAALAGGLAPPAIAQQPASVAPKSMQAVAPGLAAYTDGVLFGDVWLRPELAPRDRSIVTVSALVAMGKAPQLPGHVARALRNGVKPTEIAGLVTQLAFYTGWPNAVSALEVIERVFTEQKVDMAALRAAVALAPAGTPRAPNAQIAAVAPKFDQLTTDVIFADLWRRTDLAPRDRSLVTIAALAANGDQPQLGDHIAKGLENGLTRAQIGEAFTHLAFYAGWARANSAVRTAAAQFATLDARTGGAAPPAAGAGAPPAAAERLRVIAPGQQPRAAPASNFTGAVTSSSSFAGTGGARIYGSTVTFQPGARTHWHTHPLGQTLIVTAGHGWVQAEGEPVREIGPGDVVWTAPGVKHWHGATRTTAMTHVAVAESSDTGKVAWLEAVSDAQYRGPR